MVLHIEKGTIITTSSGHITRCQTLISSYKREKWESPSAKGWGRVIEQEIRFGDNASGAEFAEGVMLKVTANFVSWKMTVILLARMREVIG